VNGSNAHTLIPPVIPAHPSSPYGGWLRRYPLRSFLELGAYPDAPGTARGHARNVLAEWELSRFCDAVTLVVSELVTNSIAATRAATWEAGLPPVRLWLLGSPAVDGTGEVMVLVWDAVAGELMPAMASPASEDDESGRGLTIVAWLSGQQWDSYLPPSPYGGKVTRALIDRPWRDQAPGQ
jgi:hypothetical protein